MLSINNVLTVKSKTAFVWSVIRLAASSAIEDSSSAVESALPAKCLQAAWQTNAPPRLAALSVSLATIWMTANANRVHLSFQAASNAEALITAQCARRNS